jgi:ATP-dependent protease ClpP protease subunit
MNRKHIIRQLRNKGIEFDHDLSTKELDAILQQPEAQNRVCRTLNFAAGGGRIKVAFNAKNEDSPADITIAEDIGKDAWTGQGFSLQDLTAALDAVTPKTRPLNFLIDSPGGDVNTGKAVHNLLLGWKGVINKTIIGVAASTASWMIPADTTRAYKNSQIFMHRAMCYIGGNVDDLQQGIDFLTKTDKQISVMYADQSGNESSEMLDMMKKETLLTGAEAVACGMVDEIIDGEATNQFSTDWINSAKAKLKAQNTLSAPMQGAANQPITKNKGIMNKTQMLALLNKWGVTVPADATDEQLIALVNAGPKPAAPAPAPPAAANLDDHPTIKALNAQIAANRRKDIQSAVDKAASEGRIPVLEIENWVNTACASTDHPTNGNPTLAMLNKLVPVAPGVLPVLDFTAFDPKNTSDKDIARGFVAHNAAKDAWIKGNNSVSMLEISNAAKEKAMFFQKFNYMAGKEQCNRLVDMCKARNANTIDAGLQRQVILQDIVIRDFARRVIGLNMFSTVFRDVPLQGLDSVEVPYFDLDSSASTKFVSGTGYTTVGNTSSDKREIKIGETATNTAGTTGGARLYQALAFSSQEIARQPYLKVAELAGLKAEKLAYDIFQDILSIVTVANFGAPVITKAANQFDSDQLALLKLACKKWPSEGRGLILDSAYDANLLQDPSFKFALNAASDSAIKEGRLFPRVMGFDYLENPTIPANGMNLVGFAVWKYAILVAFAPVPPVQEVRNAGTTWEMVIDPATGISLEYRQFGTNTTDVATNIIESSYGYAAGLKTALKPIASA